MSKEEEKLFNGLISKSENYLLLCRIIIKKSKSLKKDGKSKVEVCLKNNHQVGPLTFYRL